MNLFLLLSAVLMALAILPALVQRNDFTRFLFGDYQPKSWYSALSGFWASELGAVTVTYYIRGGSTLINGSTTGPTAPQAQQVFKQSAKIAFGATADVQALFTHNWGLDVSAPTYFEPEILSYQLLDGTYMPSLTFDVTNTNVVAINKAATNQPATVLVTLRRPHSLGQ